MKEKFYHRLVELVSTECVQMNENLAKYTTFKIGGPADYFVTIQDDQTLSKVIQLCNEFKKPYYMIGKGSNLLVSDSGYQGVILRLSNGLGVERLSEDDSAYHELCTRYEIDTKDHVIYRCQAGVSLIAFALEVSREGYTGFEFATGIPGSVGGAVAMNAGAYDGEMKQCLLEATAVDQEGKIRTYTRNELEMGYRTCAIQKNGAIVTSAVFFFKKGSVEDIMARVKELGSKRTEKQPLEYPSAGSTFKRPVGYYAGKLIMDAGLRGYQVGGAQISEKHCGFVVNKGNATAKDVTTLIHDVQKIIKDQFDVVLETEVKFLGDF